MCLFKEILMINVGIVGISGYSGKLILKLLLNHPQARVTYVAAGTTTGSLEDIHPEFFGKTKLFCDTLNLPKVQSLCDVVFMAVPHTKAMEIVPGLLNAKKCLLLLLFCS
jgi:N-acetyl-gamma-glutamyl-phosphate reductase